MILPPYGKDSLSFTAGYDLSLLLGHLEGLVDGEALFAEANPKAAKRHDLVEQAVMLLQEAEQQ